MSAFQSRSYSARSSALVKAAALSTSPVVVHRRTIDNVQRLLGVLNDIDAVAGETHAG